nr:MAG TPA: hypothetical protein [Caudoviricetes sp.]
MRTRVKMLGISFVSNSVVFRVLLVISYKLRLYHIPLGMHFVRIYLYATSLSRIVVTPLSARDSPF